MGFTNPDYTVQESDGLLEVTVTVLAGKIPEGESLKLFMDTINGTAKGIASLFSLIIKCHDNYIIM